MDLCAGEIVSPLLGGPRICSISLDFLEITEINELPETFVLIHGAWHTGEAFETIANILRDAGHTVYCPTLRGNRPEDDRSKLGLEDAISSVVEFIEGSDLTDIRLVGHSYAGIQWAPS